MEIEHKHLVSEARQCTISLKGGKRKDNRLLNGCRLGAHLANIWPLSGCSSRSGCLSLPILAELNLLCFPNCSFQEVIFSKKKETRMELQ